MRPQPVPSIPAPEPTPELSILHLFMLMVELNRKLKADGDKYLKALLRESHHIDTRTDKTDRLTRERATNRRPVVTKEK